MGAIPQIISSLVNAILNSIPQIIQAGVQLFVSLIQNLPTIIVEIVKAVPQIIAGIVNAFTSSMGQIVNIGKNIVQGLWQGIQSLAGWIWDKMCIRDRVEALEEENVFRQLAKVIQTSSGDRKIPVVATKGTASWIDEEGAYTESDDSFGQVSIEMCIRDRFPNKDTVERIRRDYPAGTRVELVRMDDAQAPLAGTLGTVLGVDDVRTAQ